MYINCVGHPIRVKFDNGVTIYLSKDEIAIKKFTRLHIQSVAKYALRATVAGDKYTWVPVPFTIDTLMKIREDVINAHHHQPGSVKALIN